MIDVAKKQKAKTNHGGSREGSGRPSWLREEEGRKASWSVRITSSTADMGDDIVKRLDAQRKPDEKAEISRNVVVDALIRLFGSKLTIAQLRAMRDHG